MNFSSGRTGGPGPRGRRALLPEARPHGAVPVPLPVPVPSAAARRAPAPSAPALAGGSARAASHLIADVTAAPSRRPRSSGRFPPHAPAAGAAAARTGRLGGRRLCQPVRGRAASADHGQRTGALRGAYKSSGAAEVVPAAPADRPLLSPGTWLPAAEDPPGKGCSTSSSLVKGMTGAVATAFNWHPRSAGALWDCREDLPRRLSVLHCANLAQFPDS